MPLTEDEKQQVWAGSYSSGLLCCFKDCPEKASHCLVIEERTNIVVCLKHLREKDYSVIHGMIVDRDHSRETCASIEQSIAILERKARPVIGLARQELV